MKVRVKEGMPDGFFGFYHTKGEAGTRYYAGEDGAPGPVIFEIDDDHFSERWMECMDRKKPGPKPRIETSE